MDKSLNIDDIEFFASIIKYIKIYEGQILIANYISYLVNNFWNFEEIKFGFENSLSEIDFKINTKEF